MESNKSTTFAPANENSCLFILVGAIAQLVEQRTENPCVPGSIPGGTTDEKAVKRNLNCFFVFYGVLQQEGVSKVRAVRTEGAEARFV